MSTTCYAQVRGSVIRATRLTRDGVPDPGQSAVVVSKRISTITVDEVTDEGTNIRERNFADEPCIVDDAYTNTIGYTAAIALCGVDPGLVSLLTRQPVVLDYAGNIVGFDALTTIDMDDTGFALEIWSKLAGGPTRNGRRLWGYTPFPYLKGGRLGGFSFENGAVQFTISGAQTRDGNQWGTGPFQVDRNVAGNPAVLASPIPTNAAYRNIVVSLDPPAASCGTFPLAAGSF